MVVCHIRDFAIHEVKVGYILCFMVSTASWNYKSILDSAFSLSNGVVAELLRPRSCLPGVQTAFPYQKEGWRCKVHSPFDNCPRGSTMARPQVVLNVLIGWHIVGAMGPTCMVKALRVGPSWKSSARPHYSPF